MDDLEDFETQLETQNQAQTEGIADDQMDPEMDPEGYQEEDFMDFGPNSPDYGRMLQQQQMMWQQQQYQEALQAQMFQAQA